MKFDDYKEFYDTVIDKYIEGIVEKSKEYHPDCLSKKRGSAIEKGIYRHYQRKRDFIRYNYMKRNQNVSLDRHKVASCIIYAILKCRPFRVNKMIAGLPEEILMANECLAFYTAINVLAMYRRQQFEELGIEEDCKIIIPQTYHEQGESENTYESNFMKSLYFISISGVEKYSVFAYSNALFLLEKYTDIFKGIAYSPNTPR